MDTREQAGLIFPLDADFTEVRRVALPVGDYACEFRDGIRPPIYFERKGFADLFGTMTSSYPRFKRELFRAKDLKVQLILAIEGTLSEVLQGFDRSQFAGASCVQKLFTLAVKYDCYPVFCASRAEMVRFITETYAALGRMHLASKKQKTQGTAS